MAKAPQQPASGAARTSPTARINIVDRPELAETFADSVNAVYFDGQSLRLEFGVTRINEMRANEPVVGRRYPASRIVLTPGAAVELINRLQQITAALTKAGVLRQAEPAGKSKN